MLPLKEEKALVNKAKAGSQEAFSALISDCHDKIRGGLFKYLKDEDLTSEIYQHTLIKTWAKMKSFKGNSRFSTWVYRISTNLCYDFFRKRSREKTLSLEELLEDNPNLEQIFLNTKAQHHASRDMEIKDLRKKLDLVLDCLSPEHRETLEMFVKDDMSYEQISKKTKVPVGTVMSRLFYARKRLQQLLTANR